MVISRLDHMISAREWQLIGLNNLYMNLQRLHVYDRASAMISGTAEDEARTTALRGWMDAIVAALEPTLQGRELDQATQESLLPLVPWLRDEVARYYALHDPTAPLREQAAFGAAHVLACDYQAKGERAIAEAVDKPGDADRLLQRVPMMIALVRQANAAVGTCAEGEPSDEIAGYITEHVRVARGDESRMMLQIGAAPVTLQGRDPRE